jgi:transposase
MHETTIGADISKDHIDLHRLPGDQRLRVTNDRKGFVAILGWIGDDPVERIVYEPTGAYHRAFECFMLTHSLPVSKVNPRHARRFADATGRLAKTDRADAAMLAQFGMLLSPHLLRPDAASFVELKELHTARLALVKDRTAAKNRGKNITQPLLKRQNLARLKQIEAQLVQVEQAITDHIAVDESLKARFDILVSIPGLSKITAFTLLIEMPEMGELDEKAVGKLSGPCSKRQAVRTMDRTCLHHRRTGHRPAGALHAGSRRHPFQSGPSKPNTTLSGKPENLQKSPLQRSCENSWSSQTHSCINSRNGHQNPLDQNGYSRRSTLTTPTGICESSCFAGPSEIGKCPRRRPR